MVPLPAGYPGCDILLKVEAGLEPKICLPVKNPVSDKMVFLYQNEAVIHWCYLRADVAGLHPAFPAPPPATAPTLQVHSPCSSPRMVGVVVPGVAVTVSAEFH